MCLEVVGDEIWFGPWRIGERNPRMPATQWNACAADLQVDAEAVEADHLKEIDELEKQMQEQIDTLQQELDEERQARRDEAAAAFERGWQAREGDAKAVSQLARLKEELRRKQCREPTRKATTS